MTTTNFAFGLLREKIKGEQTMVFSPLALGVSLSAIHFGADGETQRELNKLLLPFRSPREVTKRYSDLVCKTKGENPSIEALGVSLSAIHFGADGETQRELNQLLLPYRSPREVIKCYSDLACETKGENSSIEARTMMKMLLRKGFETESEWVAEVARLFDLQVQTCNFKEADDIVQAVNAACREKTNGKIGQVVSSYNFTSNKNLTAMIINASYFKGLWPRSYNMPRELEFIGTTGRRREMFLQRTANDVLTNDSEENNIKLVGIPYKNQAYKLWIFLPNEGWSPKKWIDSIQPTMLTYLMNGASRKKCHIKFPRFRVESYYPAKRKLEKMGLAQVFTDRAGLAEISTPSAYISDVVHKTVFEVDGEGAQPVFVTKPNIRFTNTTGSGAPASELKPFVPIPQLVVNRPFLFMVTFNDQIIFCGTYH